MAEDKKHDLKGVLDTQLAPKPDLAAMEAELKQLEIDAKKLELLEKQANLQDLQERLGERELKRNDRSQRMIINGQTLTQTRTTEEAAQKRCNHKKGGNGAQGFVGGQGDDSQYAILKHTFPNGDMWIRCLRCGKTWKPVERSWFKTEEEYIKTFMEYQAAVQFQTRNVASQSVAFRFSDGGTHYRNTTRDVTLR